MALHCFHPVTIWSKLSKLESVMLLLSVSSWMIYTFAVMSVHWFTLSFTSYGIWTVRFCDFLGSCQYFPAFANNQPGWYLIVQSLATLGWLTVTWASVLLLSAVCGVSTKLAPKHPDKRQSFAAMLYLMSGMLISTTLIFFLAKLKMSSPSDPVHWSSSSSLAALACLLQCAAGLRLIMTPSSLFDRSNPGLRVGLL